VARILGFVFGLFVEREDVRVMIFFLNLRILLSFSFASSQSLSMVARVSPPFFLFMVASFIYTTLLKDILFFFYLLFVDYPKNILIVFFGAHSCFVL